MPTGLALSCSYEHLEDKRVKEVLEETNRIISEIGPVSPKLLARNWAREEGVYQGLQLWARSLDAQYRAIHKRMLHVPHERCLQRLVHGLEVSRSKGRIGSMAAMLRHSLPPPPINWCLLPVFEECCGELVDVFPLFYTYLCVRGGIMALP